MIYVDIDIAKLNRFASALSSDDDLLLEPFKFTDDNGAFCILISALNSLKRDNLIIRLESTSQYGDKLVKFLFSKYYKLCIINPI